MPHLSASQFDTWMQCQKKWVGQYILSHKGEPSEALGLGGAFHTVLEDFGRWRIKSRSAAVDVRAMKHQFNHVLRQTLAEQDPTGVLLKAVDGMEKRGHAMLDAFAQDVAPNYWPVAVEEEFEFEIPGLDRVHGEKWTVVGRIDGRTVPSVGPTTIDWKTAGKKWRPAAEHDKHQATIYLLADLMGWRPLAHQVTFIVFPTKWNEKKGVYTCETDVRPTRRDMRDINAMQHKLRAAAQDITTLYNNGGTTAVPTPSYLCPYCPRYNRCFVGQNFMYEKKKLARITVDEDDNPLPGVLATDDDTVTGATAESETPRTA